MIFLCFKNPGEPLEAIFFCIPLKVTLSSVFERKAILKMSYGSWIFIQTFTFRALSLVSYDAILGRICCKNFSKHVSEMSDWLRGGGYLDIIPILTTHLVVALR